MKLAILSDIHGNYDALTAVLKDLETKNVDRLISLGDNVGYGPEPKKVLDELIARNVFSVQGNHEKAMFDSFGYDGLNFQAQENNDAIRALLSKEHLHYCRNLTAYHVVENTRFVHGFPPSSTDIYLSEATDDRVKNFFHKEYEKVTFVGHTHRLGLIAWDGDQFEKRSLQEGVIVLAATKKYIVNAGSVGQPRTKDKRAQYLIWNTENLELEVRFVDYDAEACAQKIRNLGWPNAFALRLLS